MIEIAVEQDDKAMEDYLDGKEPDTEVLKKCIRKGTLSRHLFLFCVDQHLKIRECNLC